jgi:DNA-binding NtrC family response regulator
MPTHSGLEVQEQLHHLSPQTKVIIMTGYEEPGTRALALEGGAFAFLAKPLDDEAFLAAVRGALVE